MSSPAASSIQQSPINHPFYLLYEGERRMLETDATTDALCIPLVLHWNGISL